MNVLNGPVIMLFMGADPIYIVKRFFSVAVLILVIFPLHEIAHGYAAKWLGDTTAERYGRLTLNPLHHIDPLGAFIMLFLPFGWAKPVPINPGCCTKVRNPFKAMAIIAAAGPISNLLLGFVFFIAQKAVYVAAFAQQSDSLMYISMGLEIVCYLSVFLAVFNLIPLPPLDGSKVLYMFLKRDVIMTLERNQNLIQIIFLMVLFSGLLTGALSFVAVHILNFYDMLTFFIK